MERRGRLHDPQSGQHRPGRSLSRRLATVAVVVILLGVVGYFFVMFGLDRDSGGPVQRPGSEESLVAIDSQTPSPQPLPTSADIPTHSPPPTADDTPIPGPSESAAQASTATAIPTNPVATPPKLPTKTPTPAPIATTMPQVSPTPELTTQPAVVLSTYENGAWLLHNRPGLAASIAAIAWIEDGIAASESETVQEVVTLAAFHEVLAASLIDHPWFADDIAATEVDGDQESR